MLHRSMFSSDGEFHVALRDYFAAQALTGFMVSAREATVVTMSDVERCYLLADAMLAARSAQP